MHLQKAISTGTVNSIFTDAAVVQLYRARRDVCDNEYAGRAICHRRPEKPPTEYEMGNMTEYKVNDRNTKAYGIVKRRSWFLFYFNDADGG